ncbi:MAG: hypothetical protein ACOCVR_04115 [Myxococcota bacterium]
MHRLIDTRTSGVRAFLFICVFAVAPIASSCSDPDNGENGNGDNGGNGGDETAELFVLAAPPSGVSGEDFGRHADVAVGADSLPIAAFTWNRADDESLRFTKWEGEGWVESTEVEAISQISANQPLRQVSIAYDQSADRTGIAYVSGEHEVKLALSDDGGDTWSTRVVNEVDPDGPETGEPWRPTAGWPWPPKSIK